MLQSPDSDKNDDDEEIPVELTVEVEATARLPTFDADAASNSTMPMGNRTQSSQ